VIAADKNASVISLCPSNSSALINPFSVAGKEPHLVDGSGRAQPLRQGYRRVGPWTVITVATLLPQHSKGRALEEQLSRVEWLLGHLTVVRSTIAAQKKLLTKMMELEGGVSQVQKDYHELRNNNRMSSLNRRPRH
jgi:hypothetical protein